MKKSPRFNKKQGVSEVTRLSNSIELMFSRVAVTPNQIERLYSRFTSLDRSDCGTLSREDFQRIPELAINPLGDRIVNAFFQDCNSDRVNFRQFMGVLAHFRPIKKNRDNKLNSREQKLKCKCCIDSITYFLVKTPNKNVDINISYLNLLDSY